jgi:hypothetical protein
LLFFFSFFILLVVGDIKDAMEVSAVEAELLAKTLNAPFYLTSAVRNRNAENDHFMSSLFLSYIRFDASVVSTFFFVENW